jgi:hypothetical protein
MSANRRRSRTRVAVQRYLTQLRASMADELPARGLPLVDGRRWSDRVLTTCALLWSLVGGDTLAARFAAARDAVVKMYPSRLRPGATRAGFAKALAARGDGLLATLAGHLRERTRAAAEAAGRWRVAGTRFAAFAADSSKWAAPRTRANQAAFGCAGKANSGPQALLAALVHLGTGLPWAWPVGRAGHDDERGLVRTMLEELPAGGALLVADAGFTGFDFLKTVLACGHQFVIRAGANVRLIEGLGYAAREYGGGGGGGVVYVWPKDRRGLAPLVLRKVVVVDGRNRRVTLLTSVLDPRELGDAGVAAVYALRWGIELFYRTLKQTLGRDRLLGDAPGHAADEAHWAMAGLWVLGLMMAAAGDPAGPRASPAAALAAVRDAIGGRACEAAGRRAAGTRRRKVALRAALRLALPDAYARAGPKDARDWPHKKRDRPPGDPPARTADESEVRAAAELKARRAAA